jgi:hypothetical protein
MNLRPMICDEMGSLRRTIFKLHLTELGQNPKGSRAPYPLYFSVPRSIAAVDTAE